MLVTLPGIVALVKAEQLLKASRLITVTLLPIMRFSNASQKKNASTSMVVTLLPMVTLVKEGQ